MGLGELVNTLIGLKDDLKSELVDEHHPRPETWDKYGGIRTYNAQIINEYQQKRKELIKELNERERAYKFRLSASGLEE